MDNNYYYEFKDYPTERVYLDPKMILEYVPAKLRPQVTHEELLRLGAEKLFAEGSIVEYNVFNKKGVPLRLTITKDKMIIRNHLANDHIIYEGAIPSYYKCKEILKEL